MGMRKGFILAMVCVSTTAADAPRQTAARSADPPRALVERAEEAYAGEMNKAAGLAERWFDRAEQAAERSADPAKVAAIRDAREAFRRRGELPTTFTVKDYETRTRAARTRLTKALGEAVKLATRSGDVGEAERIQRRIEELALEDIPFTKPGGIAVLIDTAEAGDPAAWKYTVRNPGPDWMAPEYAGRGWGHGLAPFGSVSIRSNKSNTIWDTERIWIRSAFDAPRLRPGDAIVVRVSHDEDADIYINGRLCVSFKGFIVGYKEHTLTKEQARLIKPGRNTIAVTCRNGGGAQLIDVGIAVRGGY